MLMFQSYDTVVRKTLFTNTENSEILNNRYVNYLIMFGISRFIFSNFNTKY